MFALQAAFETPKHSIWLPSLYLAWAAIEIIRCVLVYVCMYMCMRMCMRIKHRTGRPTDPTRHPATKLKTHSYPFYVVSDFAQAGSGPPRWLVWLRYSAFIPLYPWGMASEVRGLL